MLDQPPLEPVRFRSGREGFRVESDWSYTWSVTPSLEVGALEHQLRIPGGPKGVGFLHDGASVPRLLWTLTGITPAGLISAAALVHDCLYRFQGRLPAYWLFERPLGVQGWHAVPMKQTHYTRETADRLFARIMREAGVDVVERRLAYRGVRLCGWRSWMGEPRKLVEV